MVWGPYLKAVLGEDQFEVGIPCPYPRNKKEALCISKAQHRKKDLGTLVISNERFSKNAENSRQENSNIKHWDETDLNRSVTKKEIKSFFFDLHQRARFF